MLKGPTLFSDGIELIIIIIGTFGQALSANGSVGTMNIFAALIIWRFVVSVVFLVSPPEIAALTSHLLPRWGWV